MTTVKKMQKPRIRSLFVANSRSILSVLANIWAIIGLSVVVTLVPFIVVLCPLIPTKTKMSRNSLISIFKFAETVELLTLQSQGYKWEIFLVQLMKLTD